MAKNKDFETSTGKGGETHQHVPKKGPHSKPDAHLTTNQGIRVSDNQNSLRAGAQRVLVIGDANTLIGRQVCVWFRVRSLFRDMLVGLAALTGRRLKVFVFCHAALLLWEPLARICRMNLELT